MQKYCRAIYGILVVVITLATFPSLCARSGTSVITWKNGNVYLDATGHAQLQVDVVDDELHKTTIAKRIQGRTEANRGDTVTFIITVSNQFGDDCSLIIVDSLPGGLRLIEDKVPGSAFVDLTKRVVTINHGLLNEGATVDYKIVAWVMQAGAWTNYAYLYCAEEFVDKAEATLNALSPGLTLTAEIRDGDYTNSEMSPATYNVTGTYRLLVTLENKGAMVNRVDVRIPYDPVAQRFEGSSRGTEVTDNGNGLLTWTVNNFDGTFRANLELTFMPLIAAVSTFRSEITTQLLYEDPSDNDASVTVNQAIVDVPNVLTSEHPELHIKDLDNPAIDEAYVRTVNIWGNQVYYAHYKRDEINASTCWFNAVNLAKGTYWYELVIRYQNGSTYVTKDYVEVLK
jgi:uncharacterized repeat protein (TIGR01451 family)